MLLLLALHTSDTQSTHAVHRGKVTGASLPVEFDLMRLTQNVENPDTTWSTNTTACMWRGIACNTADEVITIDWINFKLRGELHLKYFPVTLKRLYIHHNIFSGDFSFEISPPVLVSMIIAGNNFNGTPNFCSLPPMLEYLSMSNNKFEGRVDFSSLPLTLNEMYLNSNLKLQGTLDVSGVLKNLYYNVQATQIKVSSGNLYRFKWS